LHGILVFLTLAGVAARAAAQELPLGDGHVTAYPAVGKVYACRNVFRGGGARHAGPWIHGKTWNAAEKPHVAGRVRWPQARFAMTRHGNEVVVRENGLPDDEATGIFPIAPDDPAYRYDTNPNHIEAHDLTFEIPAAPTRAGHPGCLPMGMIGFTVTGVAIYNALDDAGRDANAHEVQDRCDGHPQSQGQYHYQAAHRACTVPTATGWSAGRSTAIQFSACVMPGERCLPTPISMPVTAEPNASP
jgi:hypothetical protein